MEEESENRQDAVDPVKVLILGAIALAVIIFIIVIVSKRKKNKEERNIEENRKDESLKAEITDNNEIKEDSDKQDQK